MRSITDVDFKFLKGSVIEIICEHETAKMPKMISLDWFLAALSRFRQKNGKDAAHGQKCWELRHSTC
ncbi:hypothetical protein [Acidocella sp.]|uniref:hypothetical protein n=1 Tax=Acidocella sp. TaxID=50710 RepID=UPI002606506F|nr:hypothetical protein [Acidocella sp.]